MTLEIHYALLDAAARSSTIFTDALRSESLSARSTISAISPEGVSF